MQRIFLIIALVFSGIAVGLFLLRDVEQRTKSPAEVFLNEITSNNRYISTDEIAKRIINEDPTLFIVDVRNEEEFNSYSLPGAINIPFEDVLNDEWEQSLKPEIFDVVFISNDDIIAEQAWALCKQNGYSGLYVMEGGLNKWFETIMLPQKPGELSSTEEFELYTFRTGASIYFGSGTIEIPVEVEVEVEPQVVEKKSIHVEKKRKAEAEGGC